MFMRFPWRGLMKQQCVCRFKFQRDCLIEL
ncbi:DUF3709 domain-containing protein [Vibrio cholerae]|nr:DUF3709 domain-containing protein [Vibrio cholerae]EKF9803291.1 DUF3709 domain-containing protein [Vibrio cholerae]